MQKWNSVFGYLFVQRFISVGVFNAVVTVEFSHHSLLVSPVGFGDHGCPPPPFNQLQPARVVREPSVCADQTGGARSTGFQAACVSLQGEVTNKSVPLNQEVCQRATLLTSLSMCVPPTPPQNRGLSRYVQAGFPPLSLPPLTFCFHQRRAATAGQVTWCSPAASLRRHLYYIFFYSCMTFQ